MGSIWDIQKSKLSSRVFNNNKTYNSPNSTSLPNFFGSESQNTLNMFEVAPEYLNNVWNFALKRKGSLSYFKGYLSHTWR